MKFLERFANWNSTAEFIGVICGLGILAYICTTWIMAFWSRGNYAIAATATVAGILLALLALVRIPVALVLVFGGASVSIVAFLAGHLSIFLP